MHLLMDEIERAGFNDNCCFAIRLSLDEAITNAVRHGNGLNPDLKATIDYEITDEHFRITISDQGPGFVPEKVPDPTLDENLDRPCGRGLMLMRAYMTHVEFNAKGNAVTLVKRRDCKLPHAD